MSCMYIDPSDSKVGGIWHLVAPSYSQTYFMSNRPNAILIISVFLGIFVSGPFERRHEAIRRVLFANQGYGLLVPEGVLRTGDCGRRLDGKF